MGDWIDREHHLRLRAEKVRALITQLWGDLPPLGPDPQLSTFMDVVAGDDEHGRQDQIVVHGDGLTYTQLAAALLHTGPRAHALAHLPAALLHRLRTVGTLDIIPTSIGMAALPAVDAGAWEYDAVSGLLTFDADTARLMGLTFRAHQAQVDTQRPAPVHPDDQPIVAAALEESLSTGRRYETRFRCLMPNGSYAWRASRARALLPTSVLGNSAEPRQPDSPRGNRRAIYPTPGSSIQPATPRWTRLIGFIAADQ